MLLSLGRAGCEVPLTTAPVQARMSQLVAERDVRRANAPRSSSGCCPGWPIRSGSRSPSSPASCPLSADISAALHGDTGPLSRVLSTVLAWEHRQAWEDGSAV